MGSCTSSNDEFISQETYYETYQFNYQRMRENKFKESLIDWLKERSDEKLAVDTEHLDMMRKNIHDKIGHKTRGDMVCCSDEVTEYYNMKDALAYINAEKRQREFNKKYANAAHKFG